MKIKIKKILTIDHFLYTSMGMYLNRNISNFFMKYPYLCKIDSNTFFPEKYRNRYFINKNHLLLITKNTISINNLTLKLNSYYIFRNYSDLKNFRRLINKILFAVKNNHLEKISYLNSKKIKKYKNIKSKFFSLNWFLHSKNGRQLWTEHQ